MKNLVFLCGPHGSGKSTLARELAKENSNIIIPELYSRNLKFHTEPEYRQLLKLCGRAIENFEYVEIANKNPDKIVLGNRCTYDVSAYHWVYLQRGWISQKTYDLYNRYAEDFFRSAPEPYAIVLNPGLNVVKKHLRQRWEKDRKKWNEDDERYTELACQAYERFRNHDKILYLDVEPDLESKLELKEVNDWLNKLNEKELLLSR